MIEGQLSISTAEQLRWGDYITGDGLFVASAPWTEPDGFVWFFGRVTEDDSDTLPYCYAAGTTLSVVRPI